METFYTPSVLCLQYGRILVTVSNFPPLPQHCERKHELNCFIPTHYLGQKTELVFEFIFVEKFKSLKYSQQLDAFHVFSKKEVAVRHTSVALCQWASRTEPCFLNKLILLWSARRTAYDLYSVPCDIKNLVTSFANTIFVIVQNYFLSASTTGNDTFAQCAGTNFPPVIYIQYTTTLQFLLERAEWGPLQSMIMKCNILEYSASPYHIRCLICPTEV